MSNPSELREAILAAVKQTDFTVDFRFLPTATEDDKLAIVHGLKTDAILDAVIASLPKERVGTEKIPLNDIERGYNIAVQDVVRDLQSAKSISKESV